MTCFICYKKDDKLQQDDVYLTTLCQSLQLDISIFQDLFNTSSIKVCPKCRGNLEKVIEISEEISVLQSYLNDVKKKIQADFVHSSLQICEEKNHRSQNRRKIVDEIKARLGQNAYPSQDSEQDIKIESIDINIDNKNEKNIDVHNHTQTDKNHTPKATHNTPNKVTNLSDQMELDVIAINYGNTYIPQLMESQDQSQSQPQPNIQEKGKYEIVWKCKICSTTFENEQRLKFHRETQHHSTIPCPTCQKSYKDIHLHTHVYQTHTGIPTYICYVCDKLFNNLVEKNDHIVSQHTVEITGKTTNTNQTGSKVRDDVMRIDPIPESTLSLALPRPLIVIWKCTTCFKIFDSLKNLQTHRRSHLSKYEKCPTCEMLIQKDFLPNHIANKHDVERNFKFSCYICGKKFKKGSDKNDHIVTEHMEISNEVEVTAEKEKSPSKEENPRPKNYHQNVSSETQTEAQKGIIQSEEKDKEKDTFEYLSNPSLNAIQANHIASYITHKVRSYKRKADFQKTWTCHICPDLKIFKTAKEWSNHRTQEHFLKIKCPICELLIFKKFLSKHMKDIHGSVPKKSYKYNCYICNKGFQNGFEKDHHIIMVHNNKNLNVNEIPAKKVQTPKPTNDQNMDQDLIRISSEIIETQDVVIQSQGLEKEKDSIDESSSLIAKQNKKSATYGNSKESLSVKTTPFLRSSTLKCNLCPNPKIFKTEKDLRLHRFREHFQKIKCPICQLLICKKFLSKHLKDIHGSVPEKSYKYNCYVCNKGFQDFFEKSDHIVKEHPHINNEEMTASEDQTPRPNPTSDQHEDSITENSEIEMIETNVPIIDGKRPRGRPKKIKKI